MDNLSIHQTTQESDPKLVSALARGISILRCFTATRYELTAKDLIELTDLPKPTLFRLLDTLCSLGLLTYSERISRYIPGPALLDLAAPALARMSIRQFARPLMDDLASYVDEGQLQLVVGSQGTLRYAEVIQGKSSKIFRPEIGMNLSLSRTASGRAYLCKMPQEQKDQYLSKLGQSNPTHKAWLDGRLLEAMNDLSELGFCQGRGDLHREIEVIAIPMKSSVDDEYWIFSVALPVFSSQCKTLNTDIAPRLLTLVRNVEAFVGGRG